MLKKRINIQRLEMDQGFLKDREDYVAFDEAICIFINGEYYRTLLSTSNMIKSLVVGHILGEGIIEKRSDLESIVIDQLKVYVELQEDVDLKQVSLSKVDIITTACGSLSPPITEGIISEISVDSEAEVKAKTIWDMIQELNRRSELFKETGGTHSAMLCSVEGLVHSFAEDVGRHNAVDKVIGEGILKSVDLSGCIIVSSGRQSSEMVLKVARCGIPVIASIAGPLSSGIKIAEETGITLVCFVRGRRMNIYSHPERILI